MLLGGVFGAVRRWKFHRKDIYGIAVKKCGMWDVGRGLGELVGVVVGWSRGLLIYKRGALIYHEEEGQVRSKTEQIE